MGSHGGHGVTIAPPGAQTQPQTAAEALAQAAASENIIASNDVFASLEDPSAGNEHQLFNIPSNRRTAVDKALLPVGATQTPSGTSFVNQVYSAMMDVTALPEDTKGEGDDGAASRSDILVLTETFEMALNQGQSIVQGVNTSFKNVRNHSLNRVKSFEDLQELQAEISQNKNTYLKNQKNRLLEVLLEYYDDEAAVLRYCDFGQLPRLVSATFDLFKELLEAAAIQCYKFDCEPWDGCMAHTTLHHWGKKLKQARTGSVTYRQHLIRTYIVLREAKFAKFSDPKIHEDFLASHTKGTSATGESSGETPNDSSPSAKSKCGLCGHPEWHASTKNCIFRAFNKTYLKRLFKDVESKRKALKLYDALTSRVDKDKDDKETINQAIDDVRTENGAT